MNILHLDACLLGEATASRRLAAAAVERLFPTDSRAQRIFRELGPQPLAYLMGELLIAHDLPDDRLIEAKRREAELDAELFTELIVADVLVITAPIYSFSVLTGLKAWIDRIAATGCAGHSAGHRPEILMKGKKAVIVAAGASLHAESTIYDAYLGYLRELLGFIGVADIRVEHAEPLPEIAPPGPPAERRPAHARRPTRRSPRDVRRMHQRRKVNGCKEVHVEKEPDDNPAPAADAKGRAEIH